MMVFNIHDLWLTKKSHSAVSLLQSERTKNGTILFTMSQPNSSVALLITPTIVTISSAVITPAQISEYITSQTNTSISDAQITLINEDKSTITIDMIRSLLSDMSFASFQGKIRHICLLYVDQTTIEAQNAVLKLLEEPPKNTQFWLFTQYPQTLLPTIISRCMEVIWEQDSENTENQANLQKEALQLLQSLQATSHRALIEVAEKYPERQLAQSFIDTLLRTVHQINTKDPQAINTTAMKVLLETKQYITANVSPKLALEHCFFVLKKLFS